MAGLLGSIVSGAFSLGNSIINRNQSRWNTERTIQANREMAEYEWQKNLEMWNRQNAYNTPLSQMERFKEAGLNPMLMYGKGTPGNATTMPQYHAPQQEYNIQPIELPTGLISKYQDFQLKGAQIDNAKEYNKVLKQEAMNKAIDGVLKTQGTKLGKINLQKARSLLKFQLDAAKYENQLKIKQLKDLQESTKLKKQRYEIQEWERKLKDKGVSPQDNMIFRIGAFFWDDFLNYVKKTRGYMPGTISDYYK